MPEKQNSEGISQEQLRILRAMTPGQRLKVAQDLIANVWEWKAAALRSFHPEWDEQTVRKAVRESFLYGGE